MDIDQINNKKIIFIAIVIIVALVILFAIVLIFIFKKTGDIKFFAGRKSEIDILIDKINTKLAS